MTDTTTSPTSTSTGDDGLVATVDRYFAMWNAADDAARRAAITSAWTADGAYVDPLVQATGHDELAAMVAGVREQFPGQTFRRTSGIDAHHGLVRFSWELVAEDGAVTVAGLDVGIVAEDGRLSRIGGFFGPLPELDA
jgi:hypothetical protein